MRDGGLETAIRAAGGVSELARRIGISQPSVSNWARIPAERVLLVEAATQVDREVLRPDLYGNHSMAGDVDEIDSARAQEYALLSALLARAPDAALLQRLAQLRGDPSPLGLAHLALAQAASDTMSSASSASISISSSGLGAASCCPTPPITSRAFCTSARWRACAAISRRLASSARKEMPSPRIMPRSCARSWRASPAGVFRRRPAPTAQLFDKHLAPWIGRFFADLERAEAADFYRRVGTVGRVFIDIEAEAFALPS